jgi:hypothetical protein
MVPELLTGATKSEHGSSDNNDSAQNEQPSDVATSDTARFGSLTFEATANPTFAKETVIMLL